MLWNMVDVRDVAKAHRLATETEMQKMVLDIFLLLQIDQVKNLLGNYKQNLKNYFLK